jgi:hypothetical protein
MVSLRQQASKKKEKERKEGRKEEKGKGWGREGGKEGKKERIKGGRKIHMSKQKFVYVFIATLFPKNGNDPNVHQLMDKQNVDYL